jgi:SAM-dependent methyltransferase
MPLQLDHIAPWGRLRREYELMFDLSAKDISGGILDCGAGPSSFTAEMAAEGMRAIAVDPIYRFSGEQIQARFEAAKDAILSGVLAAPGDWVWDFHKNPDGLLANRRAALNKFLADYENGLRHERYIAAELPSLPFRDASFGLAVCSHLLFLYSDFLDKSFHLKAIRELCRVASEARIFPLLTRKGGKSPHLASVVSTLKAEGFKAEIVRVNYEFLRGANEMLRVCR